VRRRRPRRRRRGRRAAAFHAPNAAPNPSRPPPSHRFLPKPSASSPRPSSSASSRPLPTRRRRTPTRSSSSTTASACTGTRRPRSWAWRTTTWVPRRCAACRLPPAARRHRALRARRGELPPTLCCRSPRRPLPLSLPSPPLAVRRRGHRAGRRRALSPRGQRPRRARQPPLETHTRSLCSQALAAGVCVSCIHSWGARRRGRAGGESLRGADARAPRELGERRQLEEGGELRRHEAVTGAGPARPRRRAAR
jgi:hypothetical protein